jgi:putative serine protease PepD
VPVGLRSVGGIWRNRNRGWLGAAITLCAASSFLAACAFPVRFATPEEVQQATAPTPASAGAGAGSGTAAGGGGLDQVQADLRRLIAQVGPSVVRVDTGTVSGSGLVLDAGTVVTPATLVAGSQQVTITTAGGQSYAATVAGSDPASDVAVLHVSGATSLQPAGFGDSGTVQLGDVVLVVGNQVPSSASVSQGIVSSLTGTLAGTGSTTLSALIETTAPVSTGSSGSAVVNIAGQVIGMTTLGSAGGAAFGVAIPSNLVSAAAQKIATATPTPQAARPFLGVSVSDATGGGALIQSVVAGGPAARAGLQAGWTILKISGRTVANATALGQVLAGYSPGQRVDVTVRDSGGSNKTVSVVLGTA